MINSASILCAINNEVQYECNSIGVEKYKKNLEAMQNELEHKIEKINRRLERIGIHEGDTGYFSDDSTCSKYLCGTSVTHKKRELETKLKEYIKLKSKNHIKLSLIEAIYES